MAPLPRLHTCPKCRALLEPAVKECPYCETDVRHVAAPTIEQDAARTTNIFTWILVANIFLYVAMVALDRHQQDDAGALLEGPSTAVVSAFGATTAESVRREHEFWRLVASMFLQFDLLHIAFNSIALVIVGGLAAQTFGADRAWVVYMISGLTAAMVSVFLGPELVRVSADQWAIRVSAGASGAICGMISALFLFGKRRGGFLGQNLANRMLMWAVFIGAYGFMVSGIDNWGHGGGFLGGLLVGLPASRLVARGGREDRLWRTAGVACLVLVVVAFVFMGIEVGRYWYA